MFRDRENPGHIGLNDALGNYSLTLIDSLSTLAILAGGPNEGSYTGPQALADFQGGISQFVEYYGDGRAGPSGKGKRARGFDLDSKVQVFETVIRGVGGLLSAHLFAIGELPITGYNPQPETTEAGDDPLESPPIAWPGGFKYDGQLLRLALDLAERLLPAFYTETGIPYPRVNLRHGIPFYLNSPLHGFPDESTQGEGGPVEITETCSAGAGSLILEFTVLSRLSRDPRFEHAAKRAFWEVWQRRNDLDLIGNGIDPERGQWIGSHSGIGAGMDSFFEYALKSHILLSGHQMPNASTSRKQRDGPNSWLDPNVLHPPLPAEMHSSEAFLETWHQAHAAVKQYLYTDKNHYPYYSNIHRGTGQPFAMWIDSLGAFYPGLLTLAGEVEEAIEANLVYTALWTRYAAIPERWSVSLNNVEHGLAWWPGRPEFIESTYYIYRATKDPWYLHVGEMVLKDINRRCRAPCGWAGLQDVRTGEKQDRMESFFLGETAKYMYLLFDPDHPLNKLDAAYVFTTEGHPLIIPRKQTWRDDKKKKRHWVKKKVPPKAYFDETFTHTCPAPRTVTGLAGSATAARPDLFQVSRFTDLHNTPNFHGPLEIVEVEDQDQGSVTMYKATSNHTIFPWTLPPTLLPENGTCLAPPERVLSWIEFPSSDVTGGLLSKFVNSFDWNNAGGPIVKNLDGIRIGMERQRSRETNQDVWHIIHVGNQALGKYENVYFHAEHIRHLNDQAFSVGKRLDLIDIHTLIEPSGKQSHNSSEPMPTLDMPAMLLEIPQATDTAAVSSSILQSLLRAVSSVFENRSTGSLQGSARNNHGIAIRGAWTPLGRGSSPPPSATDVPIADYPFYNAKNPAANFPWHTVYMAGYACEAPLADDVPRTHQVIVMRRGECSFSDKLQNIPAYPNIPSALQLVIVIDETPGDMFRPLLDEDQLTPKGNRRLHEVRMVLVPGQKGDYDAMRDAVGVGIRRKYWVDSQGLRVDNAVVL